MYTNTAQKEISKTYKKRNQLKLLIIVLIIVSLQITFSIAEQVNKPPELPLTHRREKGHPKIEFKLYKLLTIDRLLEKMTENIEGEYSDNQRIRLIIELREENETYHDILTERGVIIEKTYENLVQVMIKPNEVLEVVDEEFVRFIRTPHVAYPDLVSEGVGVINADFLHDLLITGSGVKIAILDLGFEDYTSLIGTELPSSVITASFHSGGIEAGGDHGTACAEVFYDVAPGSQLYLVNFETSLDLNDAVDWLISQDLDIISFSIGFFNAGPGDGTGYICDIVNKAESSGILFVTSSGNCAESHYEGMFSDPDSNFWHNYGEYETIPITANSGDTISLYLSWFASWPTTQDYDMFLFDASMNVVDSSENDQTSLCDPVESIEYTVPSSGIYYVAIYDYSTTSSHTLELFSPSHDFNDYVVPSSSIIIPSDAVGAFTVGATSWVDDSIHSYSSQGPTNDGRVKPEVTAPSGVTNSVYDVFYGTSASAPHVAGAAALLLQNKDLTVDQIKEALESTAIDLGTPGKDNIYGSGRIDVADARAYYNEHPSVDWIRVWGVPGDRLDPGGTIERGGFVRMYSQVSDVETPSSELYVNVSYRPQGGEWTTVAATYKADKDFWYIDWSIPMDAEMGLYDIKVDVADPYGGSSTLTELGEFTVVGVTEYITITHLEDIYGNPVSGGVKRETVVVKGSGVTAGYDVELYWDAVKTWDGEKGLLNTTQAKADGAFEVWFDVPEAQNGTHYLWVIDTSTDETAYAAFEVMAANVDPTVEWVRVWGVPGGRLDPGGTIERGGLVRLHSQVSDPETPSQDLLVNVSYGPQGGDWTTETATYKADKDFWYIDWMIPMDAELGLYDVKVDVADPHGGSSSLTETGEFNVTGNNDPSVQWIRVWGVPGGRLDPGGEIERGGLVRLHSQVSDVESASWELYVNVSYCLQGGEWTMVAATYKADKDFWYIDWVISLDAELGLYDVKVDVKDPHGGSCTSTELGEFEVVSLNTDPSVMYIRVWGVPGGRLDPGGTIERGGLARIYSQVSDTESASWELYVNVSYRLQGGDWTTEAATYKADRDFWYIDWVIPMDAETGLYDIKVDVKDPHGGTDSLTELGEFEVTGNADPSVDWTRVWGVPGDRLDPGGTIERGGFVRLYSHVSDPETPSSDLSVNISYSPQGGEWTTEVATYKADKDFWYIDWSIPIDAVTGLYDIRVDVADPDAGSASLTELGEFEVVLGEFEVV